MWWPMSDKRYIHIQILDREAVKSYEDAAVQVQRVVSEVRIFVVVRTLEWEF